MTIKPNDLTRFEFSEAFGLKDNNGTPIVSVVGTPADYYIFLNGQYSARIQSFNDFHQLKKTLASSREKFFLDCVDLVNKYPRSGWV